MFFGRNSMLLLPIYMAIHSFGSSPEGLSVGTILRFGSVGFDFTPPPGVAEGDFQSEFGRGRQAAVHPF
jgi:hypothetical protein